MACRGLSRMKQPHTPRRVLPASGVAKDTGWFLSELHAVHQIPSPSDGFDGGGEVVPHQIDE
jgi:hypothetical protein